MCCELAFIWTLQIASILLLAFGITAKANPDLLADAFDYVIDEDAQDDLDNAGVDITGIIVSNSTFMIVIGVIGIVIAGFGFFGACCTVKWMLVAVRNII